MSETAANATKDAIRSIQHSADRAMGKVGEARSQLKPAMDTMSNTVTSAMEKGRATLSDATEQMRTQAQKASDMAVDYAKDEPMKAMLIAAATGAVLMGIVSIMLRSRD